MQRDVAVVLSGGGMNGMLLEMGFLKRFRESPLWDRVGWFFGTSAGALSGSMAALDRLDDLEEFLLRLKPEETFRPNRLWRLPLLGTHDYVLPRTIAERLDPPEKLAADVARGEIEVVVVVTDVSNDAGADGEAAGSAPFELVYSSRTTPPAVMAQAVLASAAISALVLPQPVGDRVTTDGGWVRNFPLCHAYDRPEVEQIVAFRYRGGPLPVAGAGALAATVERLRRYSKLPAAGAVVRELEEAVRREERGEPAHIVDTIARLSRVAIGRNTALEERTADERDRSVRELVALREDVLELADEAPLAPAARDELRERLERRFDAARFPFGRDRPIPRITVSGSAGEINFGAGFRKQKPWTDELKRELIRRGYELTSAALAEHGAA